MTDSTMLRLIHRFRPDRRTRAVTLYGKPGCHLCEDARVLLDRLRPRYPMDVVEVDIRSDPALYRRYDILIPVIVIDRDIELTAPVSERELRAALSRQ